MFKNLILLISLILVKEAFAFQNIELHKKGEGGLFSERFTVSYCKDYKCRSKVSPSFDEKIEDSKLELVIKKTARLIKDQYKAKNLSIDEFDINSSISLDDIIELLEEDFSGAYGDEPLSFHDIKQIVGMVENHQAMISIVGILASSESQSEGSEYILIYLPEIDKVYTLKRLQFLE